MTRKELFDECVNALAEQDIPDSHFDVMCIFEDVLAERWALSDGRKELSPEKETEIRRMVSLRLEGQPLQYILGQWEFWSLPLKVGEGVLIPRPDTETLVEDVLRICRERRLVSPKIADLCSGSGGIGIEAISRGARHAYFVENGREPAKCIAENLHFTKFEDRATLLKQDVVSALSSIHEKEADVIFMDPPYQSGLEEPVLAALSRMPYVTDETLIVIEATLDRDFSFAEEYGFSIKKEKCYKTNKHVFLAKEEKK